MYSCTTIGVLLYTVVVVWSLDNDSSSLLKVLIITTLSSSITEQFNGSGLDCRIIIIIFDISHLPISTKS